MDYDMEGLYMLLGGVINQWLVDARCSELEQARVQAFLGVSRSRLLRLMAAPPCRWTRVRR